MTATTATPHLVGQVTIGLTSNSRLVAVVRAATAEMARITGFGADDCDKMVLAVDEAITNVIKHAYGGVAGEPIEVTLGCMRKGPDQVGLRVSIRDHGKVVEPSQIKGRDLADVRPGGLGVHLMRSIMDHVEYVPQGRDGTLLVMEKYHRDAGAQTTSAAGAPAGQQRTT